MRFREVSEAYEALSNSETRQLYDRYGHAGLRSGGFQPSHFDLGNLGDLFGAFFGEDLFGGSRRGGRARGGDVVAEVAIELVEAARGVTVPVSLQAAGACAACSGSGAAPGSKVVTCPRCGGSGWLQHRLARDPRRDLLRQVPCPGCNGSGRMVEHACAECEGSGRTIEERELEVEIPAGIHDGQRIRITGEGHIGARRRARRAMSTSACRSGPTSASSATATTSSPRST